MFSCRSAAAAPSPISKKILDEKLILPASCSVGLRPPAPGVPPSTVCGNALEWGRDQRGANPRSITFGSATELWFALTGKTPFAGHSLEEIHRAQQSNALPLEPSWIQNATLNPAPDKIAVLPFENLSDPRDEYFSDGLSEELISALAQIGELKVIGRSSSFRFKDRKEEPKTIGEKLGVRTLLESTVRKQANRMRIVAALTNAVDGVELWTRTFDRELKDVFAVQDDRDAGMLGLLVDPLLRGLRDDARYKAMLQKVGLPVSL